MVNRPIPRLFFWEDPEWARRGCYGAEERPGRPDRVYATSMADQIAAFANARDEYVSR